MGHLFLGPNSLSPSSLARAPSSDSPLSQMEVESAVGIQSQGLRWSTTFSLYRPKGQPEPREGEEQNLRTGPSDYPGMRLTLRHPCLREKSHPSQAEHSSL